MVLCRYHGRDCLYNDLTILYFSLKQFWVIILSVGFTAYSSAQCAMCRAVLESEAGQATAKGVNDGIVYLMLIPYVLIGGLALILYRFVKKSSKN